MSNKIIRPLINYTGRDFASIKDELVNYAQKYYPETFRDFNEASFGSLMTDMVAYVGDMLSFYTDYQANESFLSTAIETPNIIKLSQQLGYKFRPNASSFGEANFFVSVPAQTNAAAPDMAYAPLLKRGTVIATTDNKMYTLIGDVDFSESEDIVVATANKDSATPVTFAIKASGLVLSGELMTQSFNVGNYEKFLQVIIEDPNVTEIVAVADSDGNNYFEVDYLSQDLVYIPVTNTKENKDTVKNILKPVAVPRRFVIEQTFTETTLQFGFGTSNNEERFLDPTSVILDIFGKDYISEKSFDPTVLVKTDKLGTVPTNTVLTVTYRRNTTADSNAMVGTLTQVVSPIFKFLSSDALNVLKRQQVKNSLEVTNEESISGDVTHMTNEELKLRSYGAYGAQNRAVTREDYINLAYNMPSNFGQIKKAAIMRDTDSFNGKNLNLYTVSANSLGILVPTNTTIKQNLKTWLGNYKMLGDTIDILNANIQNLQIFFTAVANANVNKYDVLQQCLNVLAGHYGNYAYDIGEPFQITEIYKLLNNIPSVLDVKDVTVAPISGINYSNYSLSYDKMISPGGRYLNVPPNVVFEIKYPASDIDGEII